MLLPKSLLVQLACVHRKVEPKLNHGGEIFAMFRRYKGRQIIGDGSSRRQTGPCGDKPGRDYAANGLVRPIVFRKPYRSHSSAA